MSSSAEDVGVRENWIQQEIHCESAAEQSSEDNRVMVPTGRHQGNTKSLRVKMLAGEMDDHTGIFSYQCGVIEFLVHITSHLSHGRNRGTIILLFNGKVGTTVF